jgi:hypothetical protein
MVMTDAEKFSQLGTQVSRLEHDVDGIKAWQKQSDETQQRMEAKIDRILAAQSSPPPAPAPVLSPSPPTPKPRPGWELPGNPNHENIGMNYSGEPTPSETVAGGESWVKKHSDGTFSYPGQGNTRFDREGNSNTRQRQPMGPPHDRRHTLDVALMEAAFEKE